jgi:mono/diheme cytochrome c family protein
MPLALLAISVTSAFAADATAGKAVYDRACKSCHGADGKANPAITKAMKVEITDLKSPDVQSMSDADLKKIIVDGKGKMRPVKTVTGKQLDDVVAYVKSLK